MKIMLSALCLLSSLFCLSAQAGVTTVSHVDLNQYIGKWHEVASIPQSFQKQCAANTTAEYSLAEKGRIKVYNSCDTKDGKRSTAEGRAEITDTSSNSKLKVTFVKLVDWIFSFGGDYWIIDLTPDYSYALVGDPSTKYAWILSRTPALPLATYVSAEAKFRSEGYDTCQVLTSIQTGGYASRIPLCQVVKASKDLVDTAVSAGNFTTLLAAIQLAGLEDDLRSAGPFTIFAPSDAAFAKLDSAVLTKLLADKNQLKTLLLKHVVSGLLTSSQLATLTQVTSIGGTVISIKSTTAKLEIGNAAVDQSDVQANNGIIHVLDAVLN